MKMLLWVWILAPWVFAFLSLSLACVLTEILRLRTARGRGRDRDDVSLLTEGLADEIDCFCNSYMESVGHALQGLEDGEVLRVRFYARQSCFRIYESRTGDVLRLSPETRRAVIQAYIAARTLLDGLAQHTMMLTRPGKKNEDMLQILVSESRQLKALHWRMCLATEQALAMLRPGDVR
ncbi:hypothetical protein CS238_19050 [Salmonella enterica]|nr:hypothetical protein [Salmonella enterica]EJC8750144.1 hypothetical protein [Salmonella enterica]HCM1651450.1 hypothetical protein [Salmonella enterica subsp. diarizonae serovar 48:i:z35]